MDSDSEKDMVIEESEQFENASTQDNARLDTTTQEDEISNLNCFTQISSTGPLNMSEMQLIRLANSIKYICIHENVVKCVSILDNSQSQFSNSNVGITDREEDFEHIGLEFLKAENIRDANGRRPNDLD
uniref:Uncharacterized protein n=1 Tax=Strongyloides papillosus TaxID=174720 RepID=A0A0N5BDJ2_STREA